MYILTYLLTYLYCAVCIADLVVLSTDGTFASLDVESSSGRSDVERVVTLASGSSFTVCPMWSDAIVVIAWSPLKHVTSCLLRLQKWWRHHFMTTSLLLRQCLSGTRGSDCCLCTGRPLYRLELCCMSLPLTITGFSINATRATYSTHAAKYARNYVTNAADVN